MDTSQGCLFNSLATHPHPRQPIYLFVPLSDQHGYTTALDSAGTKPLNSSPHTHTQAHMRAHARTCTHTPAQRQHGRLFTLSSSHGFMALHRARQVLPLQHRDSPLHGGGGSGAQSRDGAPQGG
eukprot:scaffold3264_cov20-Tisochrysis_lutea.AAC.1